LLFSDRESSVKQAFCVFCCLHSGSFGGEERDRANAFESARCAFAPGVPNRVLPSSLSRLGPLVLRDDPAANVIGAVHDPNPSNFNPRQKLHRFPTDQSDILQIEEDATVVLGVQQLLQPPHMFIVHFSAQGEDDRAGFH